MTPGELKFALCVEAALNRIPEPEYRQLVVEMLMVLSLVVEYHPEQTLGDTIDVDELVWDGHNLYLKDQVGLERIKVYCFFLISIIKNVTLYTTLTVSKKSEKSTVVLRSHFGF